MACRSLWSPRWWWPRRPCSSCDPAISGLRRFRWRREPISVSAQLEKAETFRTGQLWLYGAQLLIEGGVLILLVRRPPERLRRAGRRRPVLAGAAAAAALSVAVGLAPLPVSAIAQERARDVGLVTQGWLGVGRRRRQVPGDRRALRRGGRRRC